MASEPLSRNAYVVICLSRPGPLTFTGTTLKQTLGRLFLDVSTGADSLKVHDTVTGWATKEGFRSMGAAAVPPTELWFTIAGPCSTLLAFTAGSAVFRFSQEGGRGSGASSHTPYSEVTYSEGSPPILISSIFGSEGPCLSASAIVNHGAMSA